MSNGRPLYWHEGLFLRPQHLQQQDSFHEGRLHSFISSASPFFWGVKSVSIDQAALQNQVFGLESCEIYFQDGAVVKFPGNASFSSRSFSSNWDASGAPLSIYLGVKRLSPAGVNAAQADGDSTKSAKAVDDYRFSVSEGDGPTMDLFVRGPGEPVLYLEYNLRIFFGDEVEEASDCNVLKIAEVQRFGGETRLTESYVPPLASLDASPFLSRLLKDSCEQLTARGRELAQYKHSAGLEGSELNSRNLLYLLGLQTINRWMPLMRHCLEKSTALAPASPWTLYGLLRQLVGELSTFSQRFDALGAPADDPDAEGLPSYNHADLGTCFGEATRVLSRLLEELTAGPDFSAQLLFDGTYFCVDLSDRIFQGNNRHYLALRVEPGREDLIDQVQSMAKITSREYMPMLIARALPGIGVEQLHSPPSELPKRPDVAYFSMETRGPAWDAIRDGMNIAVYFENPPGDVEIEILVIYEE